MEAVEKKKRKELRQVGRSAGRNQSYMTSKEYNDKGILGPNNTVARKI